jgi:hypothetical protein
MNDIDAVVDVVPKVLRGKDERNSKVSPAETRRRLYVQGSGHRRRLDLRERERGDQPGRPWPLSAGTLRASDGDLAGLNFLNPLLLPVLAFIVANLKEVIGLFR